MRLSHPLALILAVAASNPCVGCGGQPFAAGSGAGHDAGGGAAGASVEDAGGGAAGVPVEGASSVPIELEVAIGEDADDATWIAGTDERLHFSSDELTDEIGTDEDLGRMGVRFRLPVPRGAGIQSAVLLLLHVRGEATEADTIRLQIFDSAAVPPFDDAHVHTPAMHDPKGLWPSLVGGFAVGANGARIESPDVGSLVQHVVDRADWSELGILGFVLSPDTLQSWAGFADSATPLEGARLRVTYVRR